MPNPSNAAGNAGAVSNKLESFFEQVRTCNPFLINRVDRPLTEELIDVYGIHEAEFRRVVGLARQAFQERQGIGVALWGEAGVGKTHLLARLGRWARERQHAQFVYLHNFQADPDRVPRGLLQAVLGTLTGGRMPPHYRSPLFALINASLRGALAQGTQRVNWQQLERAFQDLVTRFAAADPSRGVLFNRTVYDVLFRYYQAAYPTQQGKGNAQAEAALRWLAGEPLTAADIELLGLWLEPGRDQPSAAFERQHVKQVFVALTQLAASAGQQFLVCLDQVDNLEVEQVRALARFLHDLLDSAGNLLVVTAGVRETLLGFLKTGVITETSWDRIGQVEVMLGRISQARGRELLLLRLQRFMAPWLGAGLSQVEGCVSRDALFPLETRWFVERVRKLPDFRPRDLLGWAAQRWQQHQEILTTTPGAIWLTRLCGETAPTAAASGNDDKSTAVDRVGETRVEPKTTPPQPAAVPPQPAAVPPQPAAVPPHEDRLRELVGTLLRDSMQGGHLPGLIEVQKVPAAPRGGQTTYDLILHQRPGRSGREMRVGLRFLVTPDSRKTAAALRRLMEDGEPPDRVLLITEERQPLPLGTEGQKKLDKLRERGRERFQHLEMSRQEYAELEALLNYSRAQASTEGGARTAGPRPIPSFLTKLFGLGQAAVGVKA